MGEDLGPFLFPSVLQERTAPRGHLGSAMAPANARGAHCNTSDSSRGPRARMFTGPQCVPRYRSIRSPDSCHLAHRSDLAATSFRGPTGDLVGKYFTGGVLPATMPEGTVSFEVAAPIDQVWAFLSDMRRVGGCVPGVQSVEVLDPHRARWNLKVKIGPLSQEFVVLTETLEQVPLQHGRFRGESDNMDMMGTIDLAPLGDATKVTYTMAVQAKGPLARIMDNFMRSKLKSQTEEFAANVKKALEG